MHTGWLTKRASLENSRFYIDCWASIEGRRLPADDDDITKGPPYYLDKSGTLMSTGESAELSFNSALIMQFVRLIHGHQGSQSEWASRHCSLDQRLQDLPSHLASWKQNVLTCDPMMAPPPELTRVLSLRSIYELCLVYLYSSVVPALSCRTETRRFSQPMLQQAAEQAYEHCLRITSMAEQYLSSRASASKLWPIAGYSAYVCAAVQLRRCLAIGSLDQAWYERNKANLQLTGELGRYWMTLQPLHDDMERQFFHARRLTHCRSVALPRCDLGSASDGAYLADSQVTDKPAELSTHVRIYAASNDDVPGSGVQEGQSTADGVMETPPVSDAQNASVPSSEFVGPSISTTTHQPPTSSNVVLKEDSVDRMPTGSSWELRVEPIWWNQGPEMLGDIFGNNLFLPDSVGYSMDMC
ncbi:MKL/myocardin-like protein 1 [Fusarium oxysporum f. sp. albedinis]|nr:MKL/myocardin-like protein 1 [Fusarium oxysporum f. sp. albedinis]